MRIKRSLQDCKNINQVAALERDHFEQGNFSILTDGHTVWLGEQRTRKMPTQEFQIPKRVFDALIRKYTEKQ